MSMGIPALPVFNSQAWQEACAVATGGEVITVPGVPGTYLLQRRAGPFLVAGAPLPKSATPMSAALIGDRVEVEAKLRRLARWFAASRFSLLQVTSPFAPPSDCLPSRVESYQNLEIDVTRDLSQLDSAVSTLPRRMVRKALREGVRVSFVRASPAHVARLRTMSEELFERQGEAPVVRPGQYEAILRPPLSAHARLFMASLHGEPVGYLLTLLDRAQACYWSVVVDGRARSLGAGHLLFWAWVRWCRKHGIGRLDLMGSPEGGRGGTRSGIARFKQSFGAEPVEYHVVYWHTRLAGLALDVSRIGYSWAHARQRAS